MERSMMTEKLKEVNQKAALVAKQIAANKDPEFLEAIIADYGNYCWVKGVNDAQGRTGSDSVITTEE